MCWLVVLFVNVTVYVLFSVKLAASDVLGAVAPPAPPSVADQLGLTEPGVPQLRPDVLMKNRSAPFAAAATRTKQVIAATMSRNMISPQAGRVSPSCELLADRRRRHRLSNATAAGATEGSG